MKLLPWPPLLEMRGPQEPTSKTYSPVAASCTGKLLPSPPERRHRGKFSAGDSPETASALRPQGAA